MRDRLAKRELGPNDRKVYSLDEVKALQNEGWAPVGVKYATQMTGQALLMGSKGKVDYSTIEYWIMRAGA